MGTVTHRIYGPNPLLLIRRPSSTRTESASEYTEKFRVRLAAALGVIVRQAREFGAAVRKGETGTTVVFASSFLRAETCLLYTSPSPRD